MLFKSNTDKEFIFKLLPREGEPVHSDLYSQIFDYVFDKYPELSLSERGDYIRELLAYKESIL